MAVNNEVGTIQDIPRIAEMLAPHGVPLHCDAAQAPCAMDVSNLAVQADLVSLSGHKVYGPQSIGTLYIRRDLQERIEPLIYGGGQQEGLRSGTVPVPLCVGMGAAAKAFVERRRVARQRDSFVAHLQRGHAFVTINGAIGDRRHPGNANAGFGGFVAQDILGALQPRLAARPEHTRTFPRASCPGSHRGTERCVHPLQLWPVHDRRRDRKVCSSGPRGFGFALFRTDPRSLMSVAAPLPRYSKTSGALYN